MSDNQPPSSDPGRRRGGLGRGLSALIPGAARDDRPSEVPVTRLRANPFQPRQGIDPDELAGLVESVRKHGVLQPIVVRPAADGFEVVAGERRWRAAEAAGLEAVPAIIKPMGDREALELALVENLQREDLNPIERARAYRALIDEFHLTQEQVAGQVGKSQPSVANALRLLGLPAEIQASLESGRISEGHARALLTVQDEARRRTLWERVERRGLSVRETEAQARAGISRGITRRITMRDPEMAAVANDLSRRFATRVLIQGTRSRGVIEFQFYSEEDLQRLVDMLTGSTERQNE